MAAAKHGGYGDHDLRTRVVRGGMNSQARHIHHEKRQRAIVPSRFSTRTSGSLGADGGEEKIRVSGRSEASRDATAQSKVRDDTDSLILPEKRKLSSLSWNRDDEKQSDVTVSSSCEQRMHWSSDLEDGQLLDDEEEEDEHFAMKSIASSRWADMGDGLQLEAEAPSVQNGTKRRIISPASVSTVSTSPKSMLTPESAVVIRTQDSEGFSSSVSHSAGEYSNEDTIDYQSDSDAGTDYGMTGMPEPEMPPRRSVNMLQGCRNVDEFEKLNKINEGTYGIVFRARDKKSGEIVALKKVKMEREREGFPLTALREINILLSFHDHHIVDVKEVVVGSSLDNVFMVMEYMDHDLKGVMENMKQPFSQSEVKCLMLQLLEGVKSLHDNWVLHRDLKTSNLLLNNDGELKICDFGMARHYGSPLKPYTQLVVTLWYRAPELLLGSKEYSTAVDMWSVGCIMAEFLAKEPLFTGKTELDQLDKIYKILGTPNEKIWPGYSKKFPAKVSPTTNPFNKLREKFPAASFSGRPSLSVKGFDLLNKFLTYDPEKRITVEAALNHEWFTEVPLPNSKEFMPRFPSQHSGNKLLGRTQPQQWQIGRGSVFG